MTKITEKNRGTDKIILYSLLMVLVAVLWGAGNPVSKIGFETLTPFIMLTLRFGISFILLLMAFRTKVIKAFNRTNILQCCMLSIVTAFTYIFAQLAIYFTTATMAGFLMGLAVVFTPILNYLIFRIKVNKKYIPLIAIVVVGLYFLCGGGIDFQFGKGEILAVLSSVLYGIWIVLTPRFVRDVGPVALSTLQCGVAAVVCLPFFVVFEYPLNLATVSVNSWMALVYVSLVCTVIVYLIQNQSLKYLSPVFVSLVLCLEPVFSAIFSYILLDERLTFLAYAGAGLIIIGLMLASFLEDSQ